MSLNEVDVGRWAPRIFLRLRKEGRASANPSCVAYVWRDGVTGVGRCVPAGALEIARGRQSQVRAFLQRLAQKDGTGFRLPRLQEIVDEQAAVAWLRSELARHEKQTAGCLLNTRLDARFIVDE